MYGITRDADKFFLSKNRNTQSKNKGNLWKHIIERAEFSLDFNRYYFWI